MRPFAEIIGDPVIHSRSPRLHGFWIEATGIDADYRATRLTPDDLAPFFAARRADQDWRGCNVTAPLKQAVLPFLDHVAPDAERIGAINCIVPGPDGLTGYNTDVDGVAAAIPGKLFDGNPACMIGAGGAARAGLVHLTGSTRTVRILARSPEKAEALRSVAPFEMFPMDRAAEAMTGAIAIVNASTLGMTGAEPMPETLLAALAKAAPGATVIDMVYSPRDTLFLQAARAHGLTPIDGLVMLIGQAKRAFRLFFGVEPPEGRDDELRELLTRV